MDIGSLAAATMMAQATSKSQIIAAKVIKDNAESQQAVAGLLEAASKNLENLAASSGPLGGTLDITV